MKAENLAVLLLAKQALQTKDKHKPKPLGGATQKPNPNDGRDDWMRFKRECILLKGGKSK